MNRNDWLFANVLVFATVAGCSGDVTSSHSMAYLEKSDDAAVTLRSDESNKGSSSNGVSGPSSPVSPVINRHIIYNADISVEVGDIDEWKNQLDVRLKELQGFVSNFTEHRTTGDRRKATWTIRIDATKFLDLLKWLDNESNVIRKQLSSKDVTEEFVDLNARLNNKKATEKRLTTLLEERSGKLDEVLAFEREIDRTREEIERIEGKLRLLRDQMALSTITLAATTRVEYVAPKPITLATSIQESWEQSVGNLQGYCKWLLIGLVGLVPWTPVFALFVGLCWFARKTFHR